MGVRGRLGVGDDKVMQSVWWGGRGGRRGLSGL